MKRTGSLKFALLAALMALTLNATGCSWIFMDRAPSDPETADLFDCSGMTWPVIDTLFSVGSLVYAALQLHAAANYDPDAKGIYSGFSKELLLGLGITNLLLTLIHGASAGTGFCWADTCRESQQKRTQYLKALRMKQLDTSIEKAKQEQKED